jgi:uncharacterized protein
VTARASARRRPARPCWRRPAAAARSSATAPPPRAATGWCSCTASPGGAFRFAIDSPRRGYRAIEWGTRQRCRFLRLPYGDQALFARREAYDAIGGFRPQPLMEDVDLVRRLRRLGPLSLLECRALTSPRRWEATGLLRRTLTNWSVMTLYTLGVSPQRLAGLYARDRR